MVKNDELAAAPQTTPCSEESGTDAPSPGHTDDEASDEEGGQTELASDDEKMDATTRRRTRQDGFNKCVCWATFLLTNLPIMVAFP